MNSTTKKQRNESEDWRRYFISVGTWFQLGYESTYAAKKQPIRFDHADNIFLHKSLQAFLRKYSVAPRSTLKGGVPSAQ